MAFLKKAADVVSNAAHTAVNVAQEPLQIAKLELINRRRLEQFDQEINALIQNINRIYSSEEILQLEQEVIDRCLREYDEEACPYIGRSTNENWIEGGGDNLEVRKRILNRHLQQRRGGFGAAVSKATTKARNQEEKLLEFIGEFEGKVSALLPTDMESISSQLRELKDQLDRSIRLYYPEGFEYFDTFVGHSIQRAIAGAKERIIDQNRLRHHSLEVEDIARNINHFCTAEETESLEQKAIDNTLLKYDEETNGAENHDIRRANLERVLQESRGKIQAAVNQFN